MHIRAAFEYLAAGRGVVFALPHMGNYDLAGAWVIAKGAGSVTTVAERVKPEPVYSKFVAFREGLGVEVLPPSGGTAMATQTREQGRYLGGRPPYGYQLADAGELPCPSPSRAGRPGGREDTYAGDR